LFFNREGKKESTQGEKKPKTKTKNQTLFFLVFFFGVWGGGGGGVEAQGGEEIFF
jgi:hypothetical protein